MGPRRTAIPELRVTVGQGEVVLPAVVTVKHEPGLRSLNFLKRANWTLS